MKAKLLFGLIIVLLFLAGCSNDSRQHDEFAKCLTEKGAVMYGTYWCSHCNAQKRDFGQSFQFISYIDCSVYKKMCIDNEIDAFPTWTANGVKYEGKQKLEKLSELTNCRLPEAK